MPQGSTTTELQIANGYLGNQISMGSISTEVSAGNTAENQQISMDQLRYTLSGTLQDTIAGSTADAFEGTCAALSADGSTLAVGMINFLGFYPTDAFFWVYTLSGSTWTLQQQVNCPGLTVDGTSNGTSIAISADGNTVAYGFYGNGSDLGCVWIYTRSGSTWTQQGPTIFAATVSGAIVSLSADGNTLAFGQNLSRQVVIYTRSGSTWTQQATISSPGAAGDQFASAVSLSADGNTLAVGAPSDNTNIGATWIFTRSGTTWTQQGPKLVGSGYVGGPFQGGSINLSADGNTLNTCGAKDNTNLGATWIFTRSGTTWTQQGSKLVGSGYVGATVQQGDSAALSGDGNVLVIGGGQDNSAQGACWIFTRSGTTWTQQGSKITAGTNKAFGGASTEISKTGNLFFVGIPTLGASFEGGGFTFT